jgi:drug/metabolite transporter (DMT)-like permease
VKAEPVEDVGNSARRKAVLIALAGFGIFSLGDGFTKSTAGLWPGTAVAALRFSMGAVGLSLILLLREGVAGFAMPRPLVHIARGAAMAVSTACFFMAVQVMPLATATTIGFTAPLMTAVLSALFLRERVPLRIWMTIGVALAGVALVLRPSLSGMGWHPVLPLGAALAMAILMMLNRVAADSTPDLLSQVLVAALASPILIGFALIFHLLGGPTFHIGPLSWAVIWRAGTVAAIATAGHWLIYRATRGASAARIAPANYVQLPIAITVGWIVFGDWPDWLDIAGIVLITTAGTMLFRSPEIRR